MTHEKPMDLLSVLEAAAKYRIHPETVRRWAREGRVPAKKIGSMIFVRPKDIEEITQTEEDKNV